MERGAASWANGRSQDLRSFGGNGPGRRRPQHLSRFSKKRTMNMQITPALLTDKQLCLLPLRLKEIWFGLPGLCTFEFFL